MTKIEDQQILHTFQSTEEGVRRMRRPLLAHGVGCIVGGGIPLIFEMLYPDFSWGWLLMWGIAFGLTLVITLVACYQEPNQWRNTALKILADNVIVEVGKKELLIPFDYIKRIRLNHGVDPTCIGVAITLGDDTVYQILDPANDEELVTWAETAKTAGQITIARSQSWRITSNLFFPGVVYFLGVSGILLLDFWLF